MYELKAGQESFTIVDGPDAGKTFRKGVAYQDRPKGYAKLFSRVQATTAANTTAIPEITAEKESE